MDGEILSSNHSASDSFSLKSDKNCLLNTQNPTVAYCEDSRNSISSIEFGVMEKHSPLYEKNCNLKLNKKINIFEPSSKVSFVTDG
jgi:hypothetical protein